MTFPLRFFVLSMALAIVVSSGWLHAAEPAAALESPPGDASPAPAGMFRPLFDGKTFDGWEGNLDVFRIEDGAIVGGTLEAPIEHNDFLCTRERFGDFELRLKFKLVGEKTNAGVQFRSERVPDHFEVAGYQADLGAEWWGSLYDESRRRKTLVEGAAEATQHLQPGQWHEYRIRAVGPRIELWIDGKKTVDYTEADESIARDGIIGLQIHKGPPAEAWYKDIEIQVLEE